LNEASEAELLNDLVAAGSDIIGAKAFIKAQGRKRSPSINPFGTARGGGSPAAAAAGSGVTSAGSRWKRAQQRVSVLSAALGKRRQQMLNHNKTAGGEDSKSHDGKNIPSGSCAEGNSPDTIQGRGRSVARTTCLLDTLIALMTSPCLVQPLDRARALLWCHSILDMLIPKKKTAAATSINAESGAGNEIGQEETEERSSRAPGQCRLLIVHAAAAALTDLPALLVRRFCAKLVSKTDVQTAGSEEESLRDATRRSEIATSSDQVDDDEMLRIEIREEAAFAVAEALHRLEKRSGLASADEAKKASNVFHPNDSSSSNSSSGGSSSGTRANETGSMEAAWSEIADSTGAPTRAESALSSSSQSQHEGVEVTRPQCNLPQASSRRQVRSWGPAIHWALSLAVYLLFQRALQWVRMRRQRTSRVAGETWLKMLREALQTTLRAVATGGGSRRPIQLPGAE
jgi:hypothetical protein